MFARAFSIAPTGFFLGLLVAPTLASADDMLWTLKSKYEYAVQFKLYSEDRSHVWPNTTEAWGLDDYASHTVRISCISGEKICYGAWATGDANIYWGAGFGDHEDCDACCAICGEGDVEKTLLR